MSKSSMTLAPKKHPVPCMREPLTTSHLFSCQEVNFVVPRPGFYESRSSLYNAALER